MGVVNLDGRGHYCFVGRRKLNSLALSRHTQLLEVLEIPQVMETCVRNGYYEEALDLNSHVRRMGKKHGNISIIKVTTSLGREALFSLEWRGRGRLI